VEELEIVHLLAGRGEDDRSPDDAARREHGATARVVVELRDDDARERQRLVEGAAVTTASWPVTASITKNV